MWPSRLLRQREGAGTALAFNYLHVEVSHHIPVGDQNYSHGFALTVRDQDEVSFHSDPKERQCQRMLKLLHNCTKCTIAH